MKLDQFISQTLISIVSGIDKANEEVFEKGLSQYVNPFEMRACGGKQDDASYINFDIAVTTTSEVAGNIQGSGDIIVASIEANTTGKLSSENISRVKFKIHNDLIPKQKTK